MYRYIVSLLVILGGFSLSAQNFEELKRKMYDEFSDFKSLQENKFESYRDEVNAEFAAFMRMAWKRYEGLPAVPEYPKVPDVPPVVLPDLGDPDIPDNELPYVDVIPLEFEDMPPVPLMPLSDVPEEPIKTEDPVVQMMFYGSECRFQFDLDDRVWLKGSSEEDAADMWSAMCGEGYDSLIMSVLQVRYDMNLCDWAYYSLAGSLSEHIYGENNEAKLLTAFIMNQSGYKLRIARSDDGAFHILIGTDDGIYECPGFEVNGQMFYLTDGCDVSSLYVFDREFPNEKALRLTITDRQLFADDRSQERTLSSEEYPIAKVQVGVNVNLINFYNTYPHPFKKTGPPASWAFYAKAPLSLHLERQLLAPLAEAIAGRSQEESANILINFVQTAFDYQTDDVQWGCERSFFPEETLFYPYSDCEDRSILYARLIKDLMGLDVVFLYYPGHLATAVRFDEDVKGDYLVIDENKYIVCDPTYINAPIGMQMPGLEMKEINVIRINY